MKNFLSILATVDVGDLLNKQSDNKAITEMTNTVADYGAGGMSIVMTALTYIAVIGLVGGAIALIINAGNASKAGDAKDAMIRRVIAVILGFAAVGIVIWASNVGGGLFTTPAE